MSKDESASIEWVPCRFKGTSVLAKGDGSGRPAVDSEGRVEMVYKAGGRVYRASRRNLKVERGGAKGGGDAPKRSPKPKRQAPPKRDVIDPALQARFEREAPALPAATISSAKVRAWTDGGCIGNPGPAGAGVLLLDHEGYREVSRYLGLGTNNIGELTAIKIALELIEDPNLAVELYTDSSYSIGVLTKPWKPKKNLELIAEIKALMRRFSRLHLRKVKGHAGVAENERVDWLARRASGTCSDLDRRFPSDTTAAAVANPPDPFELSTSGAGR